MLRSLGAFRSSFTSSQFASQKGPQWAWGLLNGAQRTFLCIGSFFFRRMTINKSELLIEERKPVKHCKFQGIQEVSWQQAVCFVWSAVSSFSWAFCGKLQKPWTVKLLGTGFRLWSALCWCKKGFACALLERLFYVENTWSGMHKHFKSIQSGPLPLVSYNYNPVYRGEKNPVTHQFSTIYGGYIQLHV